eukprot:jgi/Hompol1/4260/HPOL_007098-RA
MTVAATTTAASDAVDPTLERLPQIKRNFFTFLTLSWLTPLLSRGFKRPLKET